MKERIIHKNSIDFPKRKDEAKIYNISEEGLKKLLSLPNKNTFSGLRDYSLILLTLDTGIRPKEALNLLSKDINLEGMEVIIRKENAYFEYFRPGFRFISTIFYLIPREWSKKTKFAGWIIFHVPLPLSSKYTLKCEDSLRNNFVDKELVLP